jgi:hypothetical protein
MVYSRALLATPLPHPEGAQPIIDPGRAIECAVKKAAKKNEPTSW